LGVKVLMVRFELQPAQIAALPAADSSAGVGDAEHIGIGFPGQPDHEIELAPCGSRCSMARADAPQAGSASVRPLLIACRAAARLPASARR
jgi:hypothetical protein